MPLTLHLRRVILESPFSGDVETNIAYARSCVRDSLSRGEAPLASHLLYTQPGVLLDTVAEERLVGMQAGFQWCQFAEAVVVYRDLGISSGMQAGINLGIEYGLPIEYRMLPLDETSAMGARFCYPDAHKPFPLLASS